MTNSTHFRWADPQDPLADVSSPVNATRAKQRLSDLSIVDQQFAHCRRMNDRRFQSVDANLKQAVTMMNSKQLAAFDLKSVPIAEVNPFGDSGFGRGCLAAARLIEVGVRCVEVTLGGWDSHVANHDLHTQRKRILDPALASLVRRLKERGTLENTIVMCAGEFGRTPGINPGGRTRPLAPRLQHRVGRWRLAGRNRDRRDRPRRWKNQI